MANLLVVGTFAIDYIGAYYGDFEKLPVADGLNVSVQLDGLRKGFGGCALNIAVALHKLGHHAVPFAYVGSAIDKDYEAHLQNLGIPMSALKTQKDAILPSHALIFSDEKENQFTAFYPGPHRPHYREDLLSIIREDSYELVVLAPDEPEYMLAAAQVCSELDLPFIADPGQCITAFNAEDCRAIVEMSSKLCVNQFEFRCIQNHVPDLEEQLDLLIVTLGAEGVRYVLYGEHFHEVAVNPQRSVDPTGCGDAFRAGLIHAHALGASWHEAIRAGCVLASINIEHDGTQLHSLDEFSTRYQSTWSSHPDWLESEYANA